MPVTVAKPAATFSHAHHSVYFRGGWIAPSDDADLRPARERHEALAQALAIAVERQRALPREHDGLRRRRQAAFDEQARGGEDVTVPAVPSDDKLDSELADAQARVDAARAALAEHATAVLALIEDRRDPLRAAFSIAADEARVQAEQLEAQARDLRAEQARRLVLVRWLDSTHPAEPHPPRFADMVARDPEILEGWRREASGELTASQQLVKGVQ